MKFQEMAYKRPDCAALTASYDAIIDKFSKAESAREQGELILQHEKLMEEYRSMSSLAHIRHTINTKDAFYNTEREFLDQNGPLLEEKVQALYNRILDSQFRPELEERFGKLFFLNLEIDRKAFSPELVPLLQRENELTSQYQKLYASAQIPFDGKICTVPQLAPYKQSPDREVRRAALKAEAHFFASHKQELDSIFDKLVKVRSEQARVMGFDNYIPLGYLNMHRNCYDQKDVEVFRRQVADFLVPLVRRLKQKQAARIGVEDFKFYDDTFEFPDGNAKPEGTPEEILENGRKMYRELSKETAEFIDFMMDGDLFDLVSKDGKAPGGYCTSIPCYQAPFIFSNFNGTSGDVDVLTHEAGHAFAAYIAYRGKTSELDELRSPTLESCEVHSMSMEFMTEDWHHLFFGANTDKYKTSHVTDALVFIPYGCMVDEFQHIVYENPDFTPEQRNAAWMELERKYRPYIDFDGVEFYGDGAGWQRQLHIYERPFYYIDYCLAQTVALAFWLLKLENREMAWEKYLELVRFAGTKTFVELVEGVGLKSPFQEGCLSEIVSKVDEWLKDRG